MPKRIVVVPIVLLLCLGCSQDDAPKYTEEQLAQIPQPLREGLPPPSGGFVLAVGEETISTDDIAAPLIDKLTPAAQQLSFEDFVSQAMPAVAVMLRDKIAEILLYKQAKNAAPEQIEEELEKAVEKEMRRFIVSFGGDHAKAEAFLKGFRGMGWQEFRDYLRRRILSDSYLQGKLTEERPVTYSEIHSYYDQHKNELYTQEATITIRLIDIEIPDTADSNTSPSEAANAKASEIMACLDAGDDFADLATEYSDGYRASSGGLWPKVRPQSLAEPYDVLGTHAEKMTPGEIAGPIDVQDHIFIMKLEDKKAGDVIPFEDVQDEIVQRIKMEREMKAYDDALNEVMQEAAIGGLDEFAMYCLQQIYTHANSQM